MIWVVLGEMLLLELVVLLGDARVDCNDNAFKGIKVVLGTRDVGIQREIWRACSARLIESDTVVEIDNDRGSELVNHDVPWAEVVVGHPQSMEMAESLSNASNQNITVKLWRGLASGKVIRPKVVGRVSDG